MSVLVLQEISRASASVRATIEAELRRTQLPVLQETAEALALARAYLDAGAIPLQYENDARHVAIATVNDILTIVSWNFRHMVNIERKRRLNSVDVREGYPLLDLISPLEMGYEEKE